MEIGINGVWTMLGAILVLFMQCGFIMLEAGSTRMKNAGHIAGKTIFTIGIVSMVFWAVGYALIFGSQGNGLIGWGDYFGFNVMDIPDGASVAPTVNFIFQLAFATISCHRTLDLGRRLVSGARQTRLCRFHSCSLNRCYGRYGRYIALKTPSR
jgi:ammonia channel protein AmtB